MTNEQSESEDTGVSDVRRVRELIARQHNGNLREHVAETHRITEELREKLKLGPIVQPRARRSPRPGTEG